MENLSFKYVQINMTMGETTTYSVWLNRNNNTDHHPLFKYEKIINFFKKEFDIKIPAEFSTYSNGFDVDINSIIEKLNGRDNFTNFENAKKYADKLEDFFIDLKHFNENYLEKSTKIHRDFLNNSVDFFKNFNECFKDMFEFEKS